MRWLVPSTVLIALLTAGCGEPTVYGSCTYGTPDYCVDGLSISAIHDDCATPGTPSEAPCPTLGRSWSCTYEVDASSGAYIWRVNHYGVPPPDDGVCQPWSLSYATVCFPSGGYVHCSSHLDTY